MKSFAAALLVAGASAQFSAPVGMAAPYAYNPYTLGGFMAPAPLAVPRVPVALTANSAKAQSKTYKLLGSLVDSNLDFSKLAGINEYQASAIGAESAAKSISKLTGDDYDADKYIDAQLKLQSANGYKNRMMMELQGQSYKKGINTAGIFEWTSKSADAQLAQRKFASAVEKGDESAVAKAERKLQKANYKMYAQLFYLMGNSNMAKMMLMQASNIDLSSAQEGHQKAYDAYYKEPTAENMHKLRLAEMKAEGVKAGATKKMVDYVTTTKFGDALKPLKKFGALFDYQAAQAKVEVDSYSAALKAEADAIKAREEALEAAKTAPKIFGPLHSPYPYFNGDARLPMAGASAPNGMAGVTMRLAAPSVIDAPAVAP